MKNIALIVAGGKGRRMGKPKQFLKLNGKPMLAWTVDAFQRCKLIDGIVLVVSPEQLAVARKIEASKIIQIVVGGDERQDSVWSGLDVLPATAEIVAIHDGARPAVSQSVIERSIKEAKKHGAVVVGVPVKDTIKMTNDQFPMTNEGITIKKTVDRRHLWAAQTPQTFAVDLIKRAYVKLKGKVTDDAMAVEQLGLPVSLITGSYDNIKVTTPEDLALVSAILKKGRK